MKCQGLKSSFSFSSLSGLPFLSERLTACLLGYLQIGKVKDIILALVKILG